MLGGEQVRGDSKVGTCSLRRPRQISKNNISTKDRISIQRRAGQPSPEGCGRPTVLHLTAQGLGYLFIRPILKLSFPLPIPMRGTRTQR